MATARRQPDDNVVPLPTAITSAADAAIIKGMMARGDRKHDVAAWFGLNPGRLYDNIRKKYADVPPAPEHMLPPPGPFSYFIERPGMSLADQLRQVLAALDIKWSQALATMREELREAVTQRREAHAETRQLNEKLDMLLRQNLELRRQLKVVDTTPPKPTRRHPQSA